MQIGRIQGRDDVCFKLPETRADACIESVRIARKVYMRVGHGVDGLGRYILFREAHPVTVTLQKLRRPRR